MMVSSFLYYFDFNVTIQHSFFIKKSIFSKKHEPKMISTVISENTGIRAANFTSKMYVLYTIDITFFMQLLCPKCICDMLIKFEILAMSRQPQNNTLQSF